MNDFPAFSLFAVGPTADLDDPNPGSMLGVKVVIGGQEYGQTWDQDTLDALGITITMPEGTDQ